VGGRILGLRNTFDEYSVHMYTCVRVYSEYLVMRARGCEGDGMRILGPGNTVRGFECENTWTREYEAVVDVGV